MRRTLALLGATALAITGLAGPANASDVGVAEVNVIFANIQPDTTTEDNDQAWFELNNLDPQLLDLSGYGVMGCISSSNTTPIQFVEAYGPNDEILGETISRTADPGFTGTSQFLWDSPASGELNSTDYDIRLFADLQGTP